MEFVSRSCVTEAVPEDFEGGEFSGVAGGRRVCNARFCMFEEYQIAIVLILLVAVLVSFIKEWGEPEIIAMSAFCLLVFSGILSADDARSVFSNAAPLTIGAMFVLSAALERSGVIDRLGHSMAEVVEKNLVLALAGTMVGVGFFSAFVNNTPVVAVMLPVIIAVCRKRSLAPSKFLIPLSYAAVLGGCCTLIGTSTNLVVNGLVVGKGLAPIKMFELFPLGIMLAGIGVVYVVILGPKFLPERMGVTSILSPKERQQYLCHLLIKKDSPLVGQVLVATDLASVGKGFRVIEVRRNGARSKLPLDQITIKPYDRLLVAVTGTNMEKLEGATRRTLRSELMATHGLENLSTIKGAVIEGIVAPHSQLLGMTLREANFRQAYGMLVLAVHRKGRNLSKNFQNEKLRFGDTVLMLGPVTTFDQLREQGEFMLLEDVSEHAQHPWRALIVGGALLAVVLAAAFQLVEIEFAALAACILAIATKSIRSQDAFRSIDWSILFLLYGMLGLGKAMEVTGAAGQIANVVIAGAQSFSMSPVLLPFIVLSLIYLTGNLLTEVLSNVATASVMFPIAVGAAEALSVATATQIDPRPFIIAVAFSSSLAFASPIGYQTHMMVYGPGGYKFSDFVKFGLPLNLIFWIIASLLIPRFWPFQIESPVPAF